MTSCPEMVAGPGRFTTRLMEGTAGGVLAKEGADGFYAASVRGPVALGLALPWLIQQMVQYSHELITNIPQTLGGG